MHPQNNENILAGPDINQELWARAKQKPIELEIRQRKEGWQGHTLRQPPGDIAKAALEWNPQ